MGSYPAHNRPDLHHYVDTVPRPCSTDVFSAAAAANALEDSKSFHAHRKTRGSLNPVVYRFPVITDNPGTDSFIVAAPS